MNSCLFVVLECGKLGEFSIFQHVFLFLLLFFFLWGPPIFVNNLKDSSTRFNILEQLLVFLFAIFVDSFSNVLLGYSADRAPGWVLSNHSCHVA